MPLFKWKCNDCGVLSKRLLDERPKLSVCSSCGGEQSFVSAINADVKEVLDNGLMTKSLERYRNIDEMVEEKAGQSVTDDDGTFV